ncbi:MAG: hypothetical protein LBC82_08855 [Oscillospiraceae bacterium]|jgi:hypothetical protein|nr:hypothetical protein [Oscillospiraceae bacterium]
MAISVKNTGSQPCEVSVNQWGAGEQTGFFTLKGGDKGSWNRTDKRGFVMSIKRGNLTYPFFVTANSEVDINERRILIDNQEAHPVYEPIPVT